jgi:cytosine/adenosine deaminase-related metal-dependent hydrolase
MQKFIKMPEYLALKPYLHTQYTIRKEELDIFQQTKTNIIHCPDANLFLKSGIFPLKDFEDRDIPIGLGSDVGAGTTFDMFEIMKSMLFIQENINTCRNAFLPRNTWKCKNIEH